MTIGKEMGIRGMVWAGGLLLASGGMAAAQEVAPMPADRPSLQAYRTTDTIRVDGNLDDAVWQQAPKGTGFVQFEPDPGAPASEPTEIQVVYDDSTLYIAIQAYDSDPSSIVAEAMQRDSALFQDDSVIVFLDTFDDDRNAYFFETNANGARTDALVTDEGRDFNISWDGVWDSQGRIHAQGWSVEIAIPFTTLRFDPDETTWGLNVRRLIRSRNEEVFWSTIPLDANLFRISLAGDLTGIEGIEPGLNVQVMPFAVAESLDGRAGDDEDFDAGLDVKWAPTKNLAVDLTYNTDFAEAEVDDQVVNLTRFSVFFPEKREFFLENAGIFDFAFPSALGAPLVKPFFSRRIGIGPGGVEVPIDWGARLTGRVGGWNLGLLNVQTDDVSAFGVPEDNWSVVRAKRNLGERSNIGFLYTNRDSDPDRYNQVWGVDGSYNPTQRVSFDGFYSQSQTSQVPEDGNWTGGLRGAFRGRIWSYGLDVVEVGETYNPEAGFLLRRDVRRYTPRVAYRPRPANPNIRNFEFSAIMDVYTDTDDNRQSGRLALDPFSVRFNSDDQVGLFANRNFERLQRPFRIAPGVVIQPGDYYFDDVGIDFATNSGRPVSADGFVQFGEFYDGDVLAHQVSINWRPNRFVLTDSTWSYTDIDLPAGAFDFHIVQQRLGVSLTPNLFSNTYVQYNDFDELLSLNFRFNWIYRPGTDLFLVFNQNWDAPGLDDLSTADRAIILKVKYLLQI